MPLGLASTYLPSRAGLALADLITEAQTFDVRFAILDDTAATTANMLALLPQASGVKRLLTNNPSGFGSFSHLITMLPLVEARLSCLRLGSHCSRRRKIGIGHFVLLNGHSLIVRSSMRRSA